MGENIEAEEDEIELSLGLSIGGAFRKTKGKPDLNSCEIKENKEDTCFGRSCVNSKKEDEFLEHQQRKREMHALRRQEARRKREEKQQKRGWLYRGSGRRRNSSVPMNHSIIMDDDDDEMMLLESQEYASRVRDRAAKEHEASGSERRRKGSCKKDEQRRSVPGPALSVGIGTTMQEYPFQHLTFANGFPFPYMMLPYWVASPDDASKSNQQANGGFNNVFHPVPFLRPFQAPPPPLAASWDSEHNSIKAEQVVKGLQSSLASTGSPGSTSSSISDYQRSTSPQGGSSSDTRSHSSRSESEQHHGPPVSPASNPKVQSEHSDSSHPVRGVEEEEASKKSNTAESSPHKREESVSLNKNEQLHSTGNEKVTPIPRLGEEDKGKEKKSEGWISSNTSLPQMPYVSTTGNGPNGKTITGFVYRYTKREVSIVCVCHGNSFTPAEFVKHAGGTDISHPLKHIVLVPSSF